MRPLASSAGQVPRRAGPTPGFPHASPDAQLRRYAARPTRPVAPCTSVLAAMARVPAANSRGSVTLLFGEDEVEQRADADGPKPAGEDRVTSPQAGQAVQQQDDGRPAHQQDAHDERHGRPSQRPPGGEGQHGADEDEDGHDDVAVDRLVELVLTAALAAADGRVVGQPGDEDGEHRVGVQQPADAQHRHREQQGQDELRWSATSRRAVPRPQPPGRLARRGARQRGPRRRPGRPPRRRRARGCRAAAVPAPTARGGTPARRCCRTPRSGPGAAGPAGPARPVRR